MVLNRLKLAFFRMKRTVARLGDFQISLINANEILDLRL